MRLNTLRNAALITMAALMTGCYEELPASPPQAQQTSTSGNAQAGTVTQGNAAKPAGTAQNQTASGGVGNQPRGTLAGAKRTAENIVQQAEEASQRVADEAEEE